MKDWSIDLNAIITVSQGIATYTSILRITFHNTDCTLERILLLSHSSPDSDKFNLIEPSVLYQLNRNYSKSSANE